MAESRKKAPARRSAGGTKKTGKATKKTNMAKEKEKLLNGVLQAKVEEPKKEEKPAEDRKQKEEERPAESKVEKDTTKEERPAQITAEEKPAPVLSTSSGLSINSAEGEAVKISKPGKKAKQVTRKKETVAKKKIEVTAKSREEEIEAVISKGKRVLAGIGKRVFKGVSTGVKGFGKGAQVVAKQTQGVGKNAGKRIKIAKFKHGLKIVRKKVRDLYMGIGGEVCVLESEGKKVVEIEKGKMKKLVDEVRKCEKQMETLEKEIYQG